MRIRPRPRSSFRDHRERNLGGIRERNPGAIREKSWLNSRGIRGEFPVVTSAVFAVDFGRASAGLLLIKFLHKSGGSSPRSGNGMCLSEARSLFL